MAAKSSLMARVCRWLFGQVTSPSGPIELDFKWGSRGRSFRPGDCRLAPGWTELDDRNSGFGPGVPLDKRAEIFTPFFTTKEKGTGLGLAFVHDIVAAHDGTVSVLDAPEGGAAFVLVFPNCLPDGPDVG